ncbi:hypothetical protein J2W54_002797 [Rhodococcus fascians]|nr:hypothetical protein [Rhodococcus sp. 3258]MDR6932403.1 hypothetical protein [Rhodococcus fascians]
MLTLGWGVGINALHQRVWKIADIVWHTGRDRRSGLFRFRLTRDIGWCGAVCLRRRRTTVVPMKRPPMQAAAFRRLASQVPEHAATAELFRSDDRIAENFGGLRVGYRAGGQRCRLTFAIRVGGDVHAAVIGRAADGLATVVRACMWSIDLSIGVGEGGAPLENRIDTYVRILLALLRSRFPHLRSSMRLLLGGRASESVRGGAVAVLRCQYL